jgi:hypothetical protein
MDLEVRASDDDRQRVVLALERHTAAGRLRLSEFDERSAAALRAVTMGDLLALTRDLPNEPAPGSRPDLVVGTENPASARSLIIAFAIAALTLVVLATLLSLAR